MNVEMLKESGLIIFETVSGSHAYNTNVETSDFDIRGIFRFSKDTYMSLFMPVQEVSNESEDVKYYELRKFMELAKDCNPNIIELLFMPRNCVRIQTPVMDKLIENRHLFISKKAYHTFSGYAFAQIKKAKGQNKMVHNPQLANMPKKEDFCWVIPIDKTMPVNNWDSLGVLPCRPILLKEYAKMRGGFDLARFHVAALEHVPNTYRMYYYGEVAKGVFRGNDMLVCESIPLDDEVLNFWGLLIYNQNEYEKALIEHRKYMDWKANRNEARWVDQEKGLLDFDQKNMMHCARLMMAGRHILTHGEPIVRFEGKQQQYLMDIRNGKFKYEEIMGKVEEEMKELEELHKNSTLPWGADSKKVDALYRELMDV